MKLGCIEIFFPYHHCAGFILLDADQAEAAVKKLLEAAASKRPSLVYLTKKFRDPVSDLQVGGCDCFSNSSTFSFRISAKECLILAYNILGGLLEKFQQ